MIDVVLQRSVHNCILKLTFNILYSVVPSLGVVGPITPRLQCLEVLENSYYSVAIDFYEE